MAVQGGSESLLRSTCASRSGCEPASPPAQQTGPLRSVIILVWRVKTHSDIPSDLGQTHASHAAIAAWRNGTRKAGGRSSAPVAWAFTIRLSDPPAVAAKQRLGPPPGPYWTQRRQRTRRTEWLSSTVRAKPAAAHHGNGDGPQARICRQDNADCMSPPQMRRLTSML